MAQASRPLSPHLGIYRWYITMVMSIVHRATGIITTVGLLGLTWWLVALATGPHAFAVARAAMDNVLGGLVLFGFTLALYLHAVTGVRHLMWDAGWSLDKNLANRSSYLLLGIAAALTVVTWVAILAVGGV